MTKLNKILKTFVVPNRIKRRRFVLFWFIQQNVFIKAFDERTFQEESTSDIFPLSVLSIYYSATYSSFISIIVCLYHLLALLNIHRF